MSEYPRNYEEEELIVCGVWVPPSGDRSDLRLRSCWMTGGEFLHGEYERVSQTSGRRILR